MMKKGKELNKNIGARAASPPPLRSEVVRAIRQTANSKATGPLWLCDLLSVVK